MLRIVPHTETRVDRSYEHFPDGFELHLLRQACTLVGHAGAVNSVAISPDGKRVVSGSGDMTVKIWDVATGALVSSYRKTYNL